METYNKIKIGRRDGENIYLSPPKWDCGWYWGFGYLGNKNCHYHVDGLKKVETWNEDKKVLTHMFLNLYEGFRYHFGDSFIVKRDKDIWTLAELFETFYKLKETAEILGRGGAHMSANPCKDVIINADETKRINEVVLPAIFEEIYKILDRNADCEGDFERLVKLNVEGDTQKVVDFMNAKQIHTGDLKNIKGLTAHDISVIHSLYWENIHAKK